MNFWDLLCVARRRDPAAPALQLADDRGYTHEELHVAAERWASVLLARGVEAGERVALWLGNREETVLCYLAALRLGAVAVPLNLAYRRGELAHVLADAEPRLLLTDREQLAILDEIGRDVLGVVPLGLVEELAIEVEAGRRRPLPLEGQGDGGIGVEQDPGEGVGGAGAARLARGGDGDDLAMLLYTSGTTGRSKGAMLTHNNLLATVSGLMAAWAWEPRDRLLLTLPIFHTHGLVVGLFTALAAGASVRLRRRFDAASVIAELAASEATLFFGVPTMYVRLVEALLAADAGDRLRGVRLFCCGSAPLAPETFHAFAAATGHTILERYGMTETGMLLSNPYAGERLPGTVGTPLPGVSLRIVDRDDGDVPAGEEGELLVRGSNVFTGYWRDAAKTAESFAVDAEIDESALLAHCSAQLARFKVPVAIHRVEALPRNALGKVQKHLLPQ